GSGNHQIEINTDWGRLGGVDAQVASFTYTYGATNDLDVFASLPATLNTPSGVNDLSLGVKWRIPHSDGLVFAVKPELLLPTGDEPKALGNGRPGIRLTTVAAYGAAPWRLSGNIAVASYRYGLQADRDANRNVVWRASASAWYLPNNQWKLVGDA